MKFTQALKMALSAIISNKMRSFLTMLGIIIGVLSVTLLVSIVQGATDSVTKDLESLGGNKLIVAITSPRDTYITLEDLKNLENEPSIHKVAPYVTTSTKASFDNRTADIDITAVTSSYQIVGGITLMEGRFIGDQDNNDRLPVAVIGVQAAKDLFGHTNVIGSQFVALGNSFSVVGILEEEGSSSMSTRDSTIFIPFQIGNRILGNGSIRTFDIQVANADAVQDASEDVEGFLKTKVRIPYTEEDERGFSIFNMGDILDVLGSVMGTMSLLLGGIAGISLVVGGIGIMNIMLVSVSERTREIGIRKAIGAQKSDILTQFLIEAVTISITGGIIGLILGGIFLQIIGYFMNLSLSLSPFISIVALTFSLAIGIIFGIYPANKAAKLKPIDALRYE